MVARLHHRIDSEAFLAKHSGVFSRRLEQAAMLPHTASLPHPSEEAAWQAAQQEVEAAHLAQLRLQFGEDFDQ